MFVPRETSKPSAIGIGWHTGAVRGRREWLVSPMTLSALLLLPTGQILKVSGVAVTAASEEDGGCYV